ncbi:MAG: hypothetical protein WD716_10470 [Fimbriimonadaceae bacterium]
MAELDPQSPEYFAREIRKFARRFALIVAALASLPVLIGLLARPDGRTYLPFHLSLDDHMVYAAWMRQAMDGQVLFDNRFTTDVQPGLTFHLLFLLLGWLAKAVGIPLALTLARIGLSYLAVRLFGEFLVRLGLPSFTGKFALVMAVFGGGVAFINWHTFGVAYDHGPGWLVSLMGGMQPIDNWQPEAFVFPSMLTNGLFMAACCLILVTFICVLDARTSWKPVLWGALAFGVLMNVHSYDVLLIALVLVAFLVSLVSSKSLSSAWVARTLVIGLGAVPAALWFLHVLANDPVFRARAETLTYTGSFRQILIGVLPLVALAFLALLRSDLEKWRRYAGAALLFTVCLVLFVVSGSYKDGYLLSAPGWLAAFVAVLALCAIVAKKDLGWNLLWAWAGVSLIAPYFPALFQRKLSMLLAVPWAIIAAIALARELQGKERQARNLVAALGLSAVCLTSVFWLRRDIELARGGVSKTVVHNLFLSTDEDAIIKYLNDLPTRPNVLAMPGFAAQNLGEPAFLNDLPPILSGLTGAYTYAGHWSETPDYPKRRNDATRFFIENLPIEIKRAQLQGWGIDFVVVPDREAFWAIQMTDLTGLGEVVYDGPQFDLVKTRSQ